MLSFPPNQYQLNTKNHYKIWFSRNPNEFLSVENKIRCIRFKLDNPDSTLHLLYSSAILSETAKTDLNVFCTNVGVVPFDFDHELPELISNPYDLMIYNLAKDEIQHALDERGGNLAAASDCVRLITDVIKNCGIYSDFDVEIQFKDVPPILNIQAPIILPIVITVENDDLQNFSYNNEFIAFAHNPSNQGELAPEGIAGLREIQRQLILRYSRPMEALTAPLIKGLHTSIAMSPDLFAALKYLELNNGIKQDVFSLRQSFEKLSIKDLILSVYASEKDTILDTSAPIHELSENALTQALGLHLLQVGMKSAPQLEGLSPMTLARLVLNRTQSMLYKASVTHISGPYLAIAFFLDTIKHFDFIKIVTDNQCLEQKIFINCIKKASLIENGLGNVVIGQDREPKDNTRLNDESWTKEGAESAAHRSRVYLNAIVTLQRTIRSKNRASQPNDSSEGKKKENPNHIKFD